MPCRTSSFALIARISRRVICGDSPSLIRPTQRHDWRQVRRRQARLPRLPMHGRHEPRAGGRYPRANYFDFRITCANLVAADEKLYSPVLLPNSQIKSWLKHNS
jgi:hypothetical protein